MNINLIDNINDLFNPEVRIVSFINMYSFSSIISCAGMYYGIDGGLLCLYLKYIRKISINRMSFDFTSIGHEFFSTIENNKLSVAIIGGTEEDNIKFKNVICEKYPNLDVAYTHHGYFVSDEEVIESCISTIEKNPRFILVGMGSDKQNFYAKSLIDAGYLGTIITCGGFIQQIANSINSNYYPDYINRYKLRSLYRFTKEPHTRRRYLIDYPITLLNLIANHKSWRFNLVRK